MIEAAKIKLAGETGIEYKLQDVYKIDFDKKYDAVISSLAIHHLRTDDDKINFYTRIFECLNNRGVFFNADNVSASSQYLQDIYIMKWIEYMQKNISQEEIESKWLPKHKEEDSPSELIKQVNWLEQIGFINTDIIWKYYNFGVYGGFKK